MIAQFWYADIPCDKHVAVRMEWFEGEPSGSVEVPHHLAGRLDALSISPTTGTMRLSFALGYGVLIAAATDAKLTITGDMTVWPDDWGELAPREAAILPMRKAATH